MLRGLSIGLFISCVLFSPSVLFAQANLDTPLPGSFVSGIGYVRGWKCTAGNLTFTIDNGPPASLSYGSSRADTQGVCGDANNGFITQLNWNLVGTGQHTIRVFDNGVQFTQATFTVTTLGVEFLTGQSATCNTSIAGQNVTLAWQQDQQNFVITAAGGGGGTSLSDLLGRWHFVSNFSGTLFTDSYWLQQVTTINGTPAITGVDLDDSGLIIAARVQDLISEPFPYNFALLDPGSILCDLFVFNKTGADTVTGADVLLDLSAGKCGAPLTGNLNPMTGTRYALAATIAPASSDDELLRIAADQAASVGQTQAQDTVLIAPDALQDLIQALQGQ